MQEIKHKTAHDALIEALENVEEIENIIIIYTVAVDDPDKAGFQVRHNGLSFERMLWLVQVFKKWLLE